MIQPLGPSKPAWSLHWIDLDQPVAERDRIFLPTLVIVCDASGVPVAAPVVLPELDQARIEDYLEGLFDEHGAPDRLSIAASDEWDQEAWGDFSKDNRVEIRFQNPARSGPDEIKTIAHTVVQKFSADSPLANDAGVVAGLVDSAASIRSPSKREAMLRAALARDPACSAARIELADIEFSRGNWKACLASYEAVEAREREAFAGRNPAWWTDRATRPYLRAIYGCAMTHWHRGRHSEAAACLERLLAINPADNQGARFFLPLVHLLAEDLPAATRAFRFYEKQYPGDYAEPALLFGWALCRSLAGDEDGAREKYREAILRNVYIAPMLLEEETPPRNLWFPSDRAEPRYAEEFIDSYAVLWDRETGASRLLRETFAELADEIGDIVALRERMLDFQDQRYEPNYRTLWQELVDKEEALCARGKAGGSAGNETH